MHHAVGRQKVPLNHLGSVDVDVSVCNGDVHSFALQSWKRRTVGEEGRVSNHAVENMVCADFVDRLLGHICEPGIVEGKIRAVDYQVGDIGLVGDFCTCLQGCLGP